MGALFKVFKSDGITEITNIKSVVYREAVNTGEYLKPGCVSSASVDVEVFNTQANAVSAGDVIYAYVYDNANNGTLLGKFNCEPKIDTKNSYKFTAYDNALKLNADFSQWLQANQSNFPKTVKQLVQQACTIAGVTLGSTSWPLSTQSVQAFYADGITCRDILSYAAELAGRFVRCHTDGKVYFDWYTSNANSIAPSAGTGVYAYKQDGLTYANYTTTALARVAVHPSGEDDVAYIYPTGVTSGNTLHIKNNLLLTGADASFYNAAAQQVYTAVTAVGQYCPMTVQLFPRENVFRAGDIVSITDAQSVTISAPVTSMTISNAAATLVSDGREYYEDTTETAKAITQLASDVVRINKLKVDWADINTAIINYLSANDVTAQNLTIVDANDVVLATFNANGITIGQTGQSHVQVDFNSFELYDKDGNLYAYMGDLRDANGVAEIVETFETTASTSYVDVQLPILSVDSITINGTETSDYSVSSGYNKRIQFSPSIASGKTIVVNYKTEGAAYRYDIGTRASGSEIGASSAVLGKDNTASGSESSVCGGENNQATGQGSSVVGGLSGKASGRGSFVGAGRNNRATGEFASTVGGFTNNSNGTRAFIGGGTLCQAGGLNAFAAGGTENSAYGNQSFATNEHNTASGKDASAFGLYCVAKGEAQFAFGKYCVRDDNDQYVEIVGNGTDVNARSNARTLDWSGNEVLAGGLTTGDDISVTGDVSASGDISATGALGGASASVTGNATVGGDLSTTGDATIGGNLSVSGGFTPSSPIVIANGGTSANNATDALTNLGAVAKSGDTMTGVLTMQPPSNGVAYLQRKLPALSGNTNYFAVRFLDSSDVGRGGLLMYRSTSATYGDGLRLLHSRSVNGTTTTNAATLYVNDSGDAVVAVSHPTAWRTAIGAQAGYTLTFPSDSYVRWAGDWRNTTNLWFTIPLNMACTGLTATVSGSVIVISNNTRTTVSLSSVTTNCYVSHTGVTVNMTYSSAPSYAVASGLANVQAYGLTITFS